MYTLMKQKVYDRSVEYADNRVSLFSSQLGKCSVTGITFQSAEDIHCHHKIPRELGGDDSYDNLTLVLVSVHKLIHAKDDNIIQKYLDDLKLTKPQIEKVNQYRDLARLKPISKQK